MHPITASPATIVREFIEAFWNQGNLTAVEGLHPDYRDHNYEPGTAEGLVQAARELQAAFPDQGATIESLVAEGDQVMVRLTLRGTHAGPFRGTPASGRNVAVKVYRSYRVAEGRIIEHWALLDTASLLRQIGAMPAPAPACQA